LLTRMGRVIISELFSITYFTTKYACLWEVMTL
jgi:hypothetical protein